MLQALLQGRVPVCGIAGYLGFRQAAPTVIDCLRRLEYRGYDSFGVGVVAGNAIAVGRKVGQVESLYAEILSGLPPGVAAIGHTRWATHGAADEKNCHPLVSCDGSIAIVHNGVIHNSGTLRERLIRHGHKFQSDTDSEVIAHLIEQEVNAGRSMATAFLSLRDVLQGTYAILAVHAGSPEIYLVRHGAPLVVGVGVSEYFPASDVPSFLPFTSQVTYLPERTGFVLDSGGLGLLDFRDGVAVRIEGAPLPQSIGLTAENVSKGDFEHFMIKEIIEQTETLARIIHTVPNKVANIAERLSGARNLYFIGAGTSYHAGLYGKYLMSMVGHRSSDAFVSSDFEYHSTVLGPDDLVVVLSQSGETLDTLEALELAKARGAFTLALTSGTLSSIAQRADYVLPLGSGPEIAVAATKSYTAQLALVTLLVHTAVGDCDTAVGPLWRARDALFNLTSDAARLHTKHVGRSLVGPHPVFLLGRGLNYVTALEAALKLKEVAGLRAGAFHAGEMKHGPLALIEPGSPVLLLYDETDSAKAEIAASELASRGARILSVGPAPLSDSSDHIKVDSSGYATPIAQIAPMQVLSYELAKLRQLDPDHPRNLAKSVTVP